MDEYLATPAIKEFFDRLIAQGKKFKVAMAATMRKMLSILNVMAKTNTYGQEQRTPAKNQPNFAEF